MSKEAMKLALGALENNRQTHYYCVDTWHSCPKHEEGCANDSQGNDCNCGADNANIEIDKAIKALKEALASEQEQRSDSEQLSTECVSVSVGEPVAINDEVIFQVLNGCSYDQKHHKIPLTREVIIEFGQKMLALGKDENWAFKADYWRRMHDEVRAQWIKDTSVNQEHDEPVAIVVARRYEDGSHAGNQLEWRGRNEANDFPEGTAFYTTPPQSAARGLSQQQRKPLTDERKEAMQIYTPPFKYFRGYIHDAEGHMVSDDDEVKRTVAHRVRGWGRLSYLPNAEAIQDEIGVMMADALNEYYAVHGIKE